MHATATGALGHAFPNLRKSKPGVRLESGFLKKYVIIYLLPHNPHVGVMQKARYSVQNTERVKLALNNFLVIHPLSDFRPITALNKISPERAMSLMHPLAPVDLPGIDKIGKFELLEATLFVAYTKLANTIRDAGGAERFQTEFSLPGNPRLPIKFKRDPAKVTITDLKINPDKELVRLDYPAYKLMLPAKEKYIGKSENEVSSLFVSARPLVSNSHCSVLELNRLLRNLFASELFLEAARYAEEAIEREPAANPAEVV